MEVVNNISRLQKVGSVMSPIVKALNVDFEEYEKPLGYHPLLLPWCINRNAKIKLFYPVWTPGVASSVTIATSSLYSSHHFFALMSIPKSFDLNM
jgi:hypothetical protein